MFEFLRNLFGKKTINVSLKEQGLANAKTGSHIVFRNLPDIIYERLIGKGVNIDSLSFEVTAVIEYDEDGYPWTEFTLEDQGIECSIEMEKDFQKMFLSLWIMLDDVDKKSLLDASGKPKDEMELLGKSFKLDADGHADYKVVEGKDKHKGTTKYFKYNCTTNKKLMIGIMDWGGQGNYEVSVGETIKESDMEVELFKVSTSF